jgi:hypothetical protein
VRPAQAPASPVKEGRVIMKRVQERTEAEYRPPARFPGATVWKWDSWTQHGRFHPVPNPERYTVQLLSNGWFKVAADCLVGEGIYETQNDRIVLAVTSLRRGKCRADSMADRFVQSLEAASHYHRSERYLSLDLRREDATLSFSKFE